MRIPRRLAVGSLLFLLTSTSARAQATAELNGRVTDESGGVLPGVTVTALQTDTGFTRTVVTEPNGLYVISNLPTGPYRLEVSLQGFRTYVQTGIVLQVAATPTMNDGARPRPSCTLRSPTAPTTSPGSSPSPRSGSRSNPGYRPRRASSCRSATSRKPSRSKRRPRSSMCGARASARSWSRNGYSSCRCKDVR